MPECRAGEGWVVVRGWGDLDHDLDPCAPRRAADADVLAQLLVDFNDEFDEPTPSVDEFAGRLRRLLGRPLFMALLAEADSAVTGFAIVTLRDTHYSDAPVAVLDELYVRPGQRGRGTGAALLTEVESLLRARRVEGLSIPVDAPPEPGGSTNGPATRVCVRSPAPRCSPTNETLRLRAERFANRFREPLPGLLSFLLASVRVCAGARQVARAAKGSGL